jgi:C4-dicarboxylate-specific signal transduction histidine kinase
MVKLLGAACASAPSSDARTAVERLLEALLAELPAVAAVAARLRAAEGGREEVIVRGAAEVAEGERAPCPRGDELVATLPGGLGTLHLVGALGPDGRTGWHVMAEQVAAVVTMVVQRCRVAQRVAVAEAQAVQLEKLATIGRTAASIVHEMNNPLTAILAYSDYLTKRFEARGAEAGDVERLARIGEAAGRIQQFTRELMDYARPAGSLMAPVDLHAVIDRALGFCMHLLRTSDIVVERSYRDIPMVVGMATPLTQVFVNLISNAGHAMDGGGTLGIRTRRRGEHVLIGVADEGHGVAPEHLERMFEPFFTTKSQASGVGLGLSIVRQVIHEHGGTIRAEHREPRGLLFTIELPIEGPRGK